MDVISNAIKFEESEPKPKSTSERIRFSRKAKDYILRINEIYKKNQDEKLMDLMKRLTARKRHAEKRLKGKPL
ncbi:hypothetical protein [Robertkochia aurantiaca]|uniref:hypothetical protein n=1 Tax=Robertkochia aurantiaca TaxID=2873700 RepID=UPI001CCE5E93|nr:hypothetical protein [Robertkochia sp. 3YJGBD-33]